MIGETVSHYRILQKLGEGGMGVVYVATDISLGRRVAIKTLTARGFANPQFRRRFENEARLASKLSHPHIATVYDYGETDDGHPYLVLELVRGKTLNDLIREKSLTIPRTLEIISQVAEALGEAHRHGVVHRDIKPSNIAINERGNVKVLDFGLAKAVAPKLADEAQSTLTQGNTITREGIIVGTPMYLSPEQALGLPVDARSDLFSLGSVLYECLTGQPAFPGESDADICAKVIRDDPARPSELNKNVSPALEQITMTALAKKPEARYQSGEQLSAALKALETGSHELGLPVARNTNSGAGSTQALRTLSDIFRRPRISIGYLILSFVIVVSVISVISHLTRPTLSAPAAPAKQLYDKGLAALQEGSYFIASNNFERAVTIDNKFALAYAGWAEALAELDRTDKSREAMINALRLVKDRAALDRSTALHFEAIEATLARDIPGAINAYTEILKLNPTDAVYLDLGRAYENHDEVELAIQQYSKATELNQNNPAPLLRLGVLYGRRQDLAKSNAAFDKAETLYTSDLNFEGSAEVAYQRGYLLTQLGKTSDARNAAQRSLDVARTANNAYQQVQALLLLGTISYSTGDTKQAQDLISQALTLAQRTDMEGLTVQGLLDLGYALMLKRSYTESEQYLKQGFELTRQYKQKRNEARANLLLGTLYIQLEDADKGSPYIEQAVSFYRSGDYRKEIARCMLMIGRKQLLKGDFDDAIKTLDEQLQLAKKVEDLGQLARSQAEIAAVLSKQDLYPQALLRYTESYELNKQLNNPLNAAFAVFNRSDMLARLGRYDEAIKAMGELNTYLSNLSSDNSYRKLWESWSHLVLARMYLSERYLGEARTECERAWTTVAANDKETAAEINATRGLIDVFSGAEANGRLLCNKAVKLAGPSISEHSGHAQLALAEALLESGDAKAASATALAAQKTLDALGVPEHEWRAWLIAARSNQRLGNLSEMRDQLTRSRTLFEKLKQSWGADAFNSYVRRKDIQNCKKQLDDLTATL